MSVLSVRDLVSKYRGVTAVDGAGFEVGRGEFVGLLGANGAGKSTLLKTISGLHAAHSGKIIFEGREIQSLTPENIFKMGIVQVPEGRHMIPGLTVMDNLLLGGASRVDKPSRAALRKEVDEILALFPGLTKVINRSAWTLSGGEQQMCAVGRGLMGKPKLLVLDEPSLGLAPVVVQELFRQICEINRRGITILLVEQNAHLALEITSRVYVMQLGRVVYENTSEEAKCDAALISSFLGTD